MFGLAPLYTSYSCMLGKFRVSGRHRAAFAFFTMTVVSTIGTPARCSQAEVKGFLLDYTSLKITAEPSFFCPLTGSAPTMLCFGATPRALISSRLLAGLLSQQSLKFM